MEEKPNPLMVSGALKRPRSNDQLAEPQSVQPILPELEKINGQNTFDEPAAKRIKAEDSLKDAVSPRVKGEVSIKPE